ncbi:MAG: hypothetical protein ABIJ61_11635 [bacterium]
MRSLLALIIAGFMLAILPSTGTYGDVILEVGLNGGYTDNLLSDSTSLSDRHSSESVSVRYYPLSLLEVSASVDHTYYDRVLNLTNYHTGLSLTFIPTKAGARFSAYLTGTYGGKRYRQDFNDYDNNDFAGTLSCGYRLLPNLLLRAGMQLMGTAYLAYDSGDQQSLEFFSGMNVTLPYNNAFDLEVGYGLADLRHYPNPEVITRNIELKTFDPTNPEGSLENGTLRSIYVSPRISRPIGNRTGISLAFTNRIFQNSYKMVVAGSSVGLLSPWTGMWDGWSATLTVKTYLLPSFVISGGLGYWEKTFIDVLDGNDLPKFIPYDREDYQRRVFLTIQRPVTLGGIVLQPNLQLSYVNNTSNMTSHKANWPSPADNLYDYSGFTATVGISFRL